MAADGHAAYAERAMRPAEAAVSEPPQRGQVRRHVTPLVASAVPPAVCAACGHPSTSAGA
jgi:hypothetical protein